MLRCIYGCQKWVPDKILHRYSNSIFFSTFIFFNKKIFSKIKKYFSKIKIKNPLAKKYFFFRIKFENFRKNIFFISKKYFFYEKIKLRKKSNYYIDAEFCQESISGNHKWNGALLCSGESNFYILQVFFILNAEKTGISSLNFVTLLCTSSVICGM